MHRTGGWLLGWRAIHEGSRNRERAKTLFLTGTPASSQPQQREASGGPDACIPPRRSAFAFSRFRDAPGTTRARVATRALVGIRIYVERPRGAGGWYRATGNGPQATGR